MFFACRSLAFAAVMTLLAAGCRRETRDFDHGGPSAGEIESAKPARTAPRGPEAAEEMNALALSEGKRLYSQFNCGTCHAQGGGDIGPALRDAKWIYGPSSRDVYTSIMDGRPNGMPAFRARITDTQARQLAAFVRSLSGQAQPNAATSREDHMKTTPSESSVERRTPVLDSSPKL